MKLSRKRFLQAAVLTGALALPAAIGLNFLRAASGAIPARESPYEPSANDSVTGSPPLLILTAPPASPNPFSMVLAEILRAEGFPTFAAASLDAIALEELAQFDTVILAEQDLDAANAARLENFVRRGGALIAMRPAAALSAWFGVNRLEGVTSNASIRVVTAHPLTTGIEPTPLQFHGDADRYALHGAQAVATSLDGTPALTLYPYGAGYTMLWAYDLARSIVLTRQGNPARINQMYPGQDAVRAVSLFADGWLNLDWLPIAHADEQQRLLANALHFFSQTRRPLPRIWYFPFNANGIFIPTSDTHHQLAEPIEQVLTRVERVGGHASIYYTPNLSAGALPRAEMRARDELLNAIPALSAVNRKRIDAPSDTQIAQWRARGHEFGLHPYVEEGLESGWVRYLREYSGRGYEPLGRTTRTHRVLWQGWTDTAELQAEYGMRMNFDYYHWGLPFRTNDDAWAAGYMTGSGLPMRFVDLQGRILEIFQQHTALVDEHLLDLGWTVAGQHTMPLADALSFADAVLACMTRTPTALAAQFHTDPFAGTNAAALANATGFLEGVLERVARANLPIVSAESWLAFTLARAQARLTEMQWSESQGQLNLRLMATTALPLLLPLIHHDRTLHAVELDGAQTEFQKRTVGGVSYAAVNVQPTQAVTAFY